MSVEESIKGLGHLINGKIVRGDATFPVDNPSTGEIIAQSPSATKEMLDEAMAAAEAAQPGWYASGEENRRAVIAALATALTDNFAALNELAELEKGTKMAAGEAYFAAMFGQHAAAAPLPVDIIEETDDKIIRVVRKPVGVVAAISPWNAPILIMADKVFTALLVGDTVVAKPSPFTPLASLKMGEIWKDIAPPGVINILAGGDDIGAAMVSHPTTRMISFTGSAAAGKKIAEAAGKGMKNFVCELGGNDAAIVLGDVDVQTVAPKLFGSAMGGTGQICAAIKRVYVHESIYEDMVDALANIARETKAAPAEEGGTMGPLSTKPQYDRVVMLVEDALEHGGKAVAGGSPIDGPGYYYPPTIITNVGAGVRVVDEEQFGPVLPVISFSDEDDAIRQANATEYGLCGSVWTSDVKHGEELAARLECGTAWVNAHTEVAPHVPFGGVKGSGVGRNCGQVGIDAYAELQTQIIYKSKDRVTSA